MDGDWMDEEGAGWEDSKRKRNEGVGMDDQ